MENEILIMKKFTFKYICNQNQKKIIIFYLIIAIFMLGTILKLKKKIIKIQKENEKNKDNALFYKEMLSLYIDNRTEFMIKGRQKVMSWNGQIYNESNLITIQDKLNWLIIHEFPENKTNLVDKILLHEYSKKILGKDICVPILKIYNSIEEINLNELPEKFVIKCNHGSGMNILCNNKSNLNFTEVKFLLNKWKNINYGIKNFEYQYINVKKAFFVEKYLTDNINDYKFYCFNGEPKFIRVQKNLPDKKGKINNYYNLDWTLNDIETNFAKYYRKPEIKFDKPKHLDLMIEYSRKLSKEFCFVRVDLYEFNDTIYLGELTFTPTNILMKNKNLSQRKYLGNLLDINKIKNYN